MNNVISLDFDFWVEFPEWENLDWGFRETPFWIDHMWALRAGDALSNGVDLRKTITLADDEVPPGGFVESIVCDGTKIGNSKLAISESHAPAYKYLSGLKDMHVVHIDAHHDMGYEMKELNCDNWLMNLAKDGNVRKITMIYPKWRLRRMNEWDSAKARVTEALEGLGVELEVHFGLEFMPVLKNVRRIFLSHSGAWTPPWLDQYFRELMASLFRVRGGVMLYGAKSLDELSRKLDWDEIQKHADGMRTLKANMEKPNGCLQRST